MVIDHDPDYRPELLRVRAMTAVIALGLFAIVARLWYLQVAHGPELLAQAEGNRTRLVRRVPPRGQIVDARGRVLATNRPLLSVFVVPYEAMPRKNSQTRRMEDPGSLGRLAPLLNITEEELKRTIERNLVTPYEPVRVAARISMETATQVEEQRMGMPGVFVMEEPVREYPSGQLLGHVLGQMGEISKEELEKPENEGYRPGDYCGKLGIEKAFDSALRGHAGGDRMDVDARGRIRGVLASSDPVPGDTVHLTIDTQLQRVAYEALNSWAKRGKPGAAVALDPATGAVLALASVPSYDPNAYAAGISKADWDSLRANPLKPLINRAVGSATAPGSTFKMITAAAGLELGLVSVHTRTTCTGVIYLGKWPKRCHKRSGHGSLNLKEAIAQSCDVYFYRLGQRLGPERLAAYARRFGLGQRLGIDLPGVEAKGIVPDPEWKRQRKLGPWVGGDTVDFAIGQSSLATTPLQMASVCAAIANGGTLYRPQLVRAITRWDGRSGSQVVRGLVPEIARKVEVSPATMRTLVESMEAVMTRGTGARSAIPGLRMAGKTGTAEVARRGRKVDNAWFIGFAPVENPRIAVCVFIETGGHGGEAAAPIARKIIAAHLGVKVDDVQVGRADD